MCNDATDAVQMNTGPNSVLVLILLLRHIIKAICTMKSSRHLVVLRKKTAPLNFATGEIIQDRAQQMERWVEHYPELPARENMVSLEALNATACLLWIMNLLKWSWKRPWSTCTWKSARPGWWYSGCARGKKGTTMMKDANIVTLYKNWESVAWHPKNGCEGDYTKTGRPKETALTIIKGSNSPVSL